jgi:hypothetical protein
MNIHGISIRCVETDEEILALKASWEELHGNSIAPSVYNSFLFIYESIQAFNYDEVTKKVFTLTDDKTHQLLAIFPMQQYVSTWHFIPFNTLETTALNEIMDKPFPVIRTGFHDISWRVFFTHLKDNISDWHHFFLRDVPFSYPVLKLIPGICKELNLEYQLNYDSISTEISVEGEWDDFWQQHRTMRRNMGKLERDFGDRLAFTIYDDKWQWCLDKYIELENKTWKKGLGVTASEDTISFYYNLCEKLDVTGQLKFGFLTVDDQLITATIAYTQGDTVYFPQGCYDPEYKKYSPNMVNLTYFLKHLYGTPFKKVDCLCGYADFLSKWTDTEIKTYDINIYNKRPLVRLMLAWQILEVKIAALNNRLATRFKWKVDASNKGKLSKK